MTVDQEFDATFLLACELGQRQRNRDGLVWTAQGWMIRDPQTGELRKKVRNEKGR